MITFEQLKDVLLQGDIEIHSDNPLLSDEEFTEWANDLEAKFYKAKTLLDLVHIYEGRFNGWETYDAFKHIIDTLMATATLDQAAFRSYIYVTQLKIKKYESYK